MTATSGFSLTPDFDPIPFRPLINIGALLDIPTGNYVTGVHGESLLSGGLGMLTGVVGIGNNFKSGTLHYMMLSAMSRIAYAQRTNYTPYDTEINMNDDSRLLQFASAFPQFAGRDLTSTGELRITNKVMYRGNKWFEKFKEYVDGKVGSGKQWMKDTPFTEKDGKTLFKMLVPTFGAIDSLSDFDTEDVTKLQDENELGDSGANMMHMRQGAAKTRLLMELPVLCSRALHFLGITAQMGKDIPMATGPYAPPPKKQLQYLKNGDKLKQVSDKFFFLMSNCWHAYNMSPLVTKDRTPAYPREGEGDNTTIGTDLNIVSLRQLRSKTGPTGITLEIIVSQQGGVLPSLTEFHYIKENERFGLEGNDRSYSLSLLPDVKLQRTTVRTKLAEDPLLQRAVNISAELLQMIQFWTHMDPAFLCTPKELYDDLKAKGYDWDVLLRTRGWWTLDNDKHEIKYLSTRDLLNMRAGTYHPYWMAPLKPTK